MHLNKKQYEKTLFEICNIIVVFDRALVQDRQFKEKDDRGLLYR